MTITLTRTPRGSVFGTANWCANPTAQNDTANWSYSWYGPSVGGTSDRATGLAFGSSQPGLGKVTTALRKTSSSATTSVAEHGFYYTTPANLNWGPGAVFYASGWWWANQGQTILIRAKYYNSAGALIGTQDGPKQQSGYQLWSRLQGGPFTVPANADPARTQIWFCTFGGDAAGLPSGYSELLTAVSLTVDNAALSQSYFDGNSLPWGDITFGWTGTAGSSWTIEYVPDPASILVPTLVLGYDSARPSRNVVHQLLSGSVAAVLYPASTRRGTLRLFFEDDASATNADRQLAKSGTWSFADTDHPDENMLCVTSGDVRKYQTDNRMRWTVEVPFQELTP